MTNLPKGALVQIYCLGQWGACSRFTGRGGGSCLSACLPMTNLPFQIYYQGCFTTLHFNHYSSFQPLFLGSLCLSCSRVNAWGCFFHLSLFIIIYYMQLVYCPIPQNTVTECGLWVVHSNNLHFKRPPDPASSWSVCACTIPDIVPGVPSLSPFQTNLHFSWGCLCLHCSRDSSWYLPPFYFKCPPLLPVVCVLASYLVTIQRWEGENNLCVHICACLRVELYR